MMHPQSTDHVPVKFRVKFVITINVNPDRNYSQTCSWWEFFSLQGGAPASGQWAAEYVGARPLDSRQLETLSRQQYYYTSTAASYLNHVVSKLESRFYTRDSLPFLENLP